MNQEDLSKTRLRTVQYRFEDGIVELGLGMMALLASVYFYLQVVMANRELAATLSASFALIVVAGLFVFQGFVASLKNRITIPRTGFVAYRKGEGGRSLLITVAMGLIVLTAGLLVFSQITTPAAWNLLPIFTGFLMALGLALIGLYAALTRFYVLAAASLILGLVFAISPISNDLATAAYCGALGLVLLGSGGMILRRYLRQNPAPTEANNGQ